MKPQKIYISQLCKHTLFKIANKELIRRRDAPIFPRNSAAAARLLSPQLSRLIRRGGKSRPANADCVNQNRFFSSSSSSLLFFFFKPVQVFPARTGLKFRDERDRVESVADQSRAENTAGAEYLKGRRK